MKRYSSKRGMLGIALLLALSAGATALPAPQSPQENQNPDLTRQELAAFDRFVDQHPDVAKQLHNNPSVIGNEEFLENHAQLREFLEDHPKVREELTENPGLFMHREGQFEGSKRDWDGAPQSTPAGNPDLKGSQVATFDRFLDEHPDVAKEVQKNPSLIQNEEFLENHPQLQTFLKDHPEVREELTENPGLFMHRAEQFEGSKKDWDGAPKENPAANPDLTRGQVAVFDQFLDKHPKIAEQLEGNPALVNDKGFLKKNHELSDFLKDHKEIREELTENPSFFMRHEQKFEAGEHDNISKTNPELSDKEIATLDQFLDKHPKIAEQLEGNPALVNDKGFLKKNHELADFLKGHRDLREAFKENPSLAMQREARLDNEHDRDRHHGKDADRRARQSREERARLEREKERFKH